MKARSSLPPYTTLRPLLRLEIVITRLTKRLVIALSFKCTRSVRVKERRNIRIDFRNRAQRADGKIRGVIRKLLILGPTKETPAAVIPVIRHFAIHEPNLLSFLEDLLAREAAAVKYVHGVPF